ncbi:MAG: hypothetical protein GY778_28230 [bacterium]|nr:hypothetical protein [bacterium]
MLMTGRRRPPAPVAPSTSSDSGFSLVEGLIAAALLLVIAVSILPIFVRALDNNLSGGRRSQLSTFASGDLEALNQVPIDQDAWSVAGEPGGVLSLGSRFWANGSVSNPVTLGDERWVDLETDAPGELILWQSDAAIRKYSLADIQILVGAGGGLVSGGANPMLFDNPLTDDEGGHFTELRLTIKENRDALPAASGRRITIGHFRAF